jgi:hypothetical protein
MSKAELKRLEKKIDEQHVEMKKFVEEVVKLASITNLKWAERFDVVGEKHQKAMFYRGLIMGLILGILGNVLVSYWMEYLKAFSIPLWLWALGTAFAFLAVFGLIWRLDRESRRQPE